MRRLFRDMRSLADDLVGWGLTLTSERLLEMASRIGADPQPATIREVRTKILEWRGGIVDGTFGLIIPDDLTGILGQLRELQHDLED